MMVTVCFAIRVASQIPISKSLAHLFLPSMTLRKEIIFSSGNVGIESGDDSDETVSDGV